MFVSWTFLEKALLVLSLIISIGIILSKIKFIPTIIRKVFRRQYKFDLDYQNICFGLFFDPNNPKHDLSLCLFVYNLHIVNCSDKPNTLKSIKLSYRFSGKKYLTESNNVQTEKEPKSGEPVITLWNGINTIYVKPWYNIRQKLGLKETFQPGAVFHGSSAFLFEPRAKDARSIDNLSLIVSDFHGNESVHPVVIKEEWFDSLNAGFAIMNK